MKSVKADGQLTVTVTLENNPGIHSMRMKFNYNPQALRLASYANGSVWKDGDNPNSSKTIF